MNIMEMREIILAASKQVKKAKNFRDVDIEINYGLPSISIGMNGSEFFGQGESARDLIIAAIAASNKFHLRINDCLLWHLESAGVFQS